MRSKLPNKELDFQIRVHVIEGRKLVGGQLNAVTKVSVANDVKETSTRKGTNQPFWDEMIYFNMKMRPSELFDKVLEIRVMNAKRVLRDAMIGSFKLDVGMAYDEPEHCFIHKWLLLTDPNDPGDGPKGYLKVSIHIIGPGDDPKPSPPVLPSESVDIESNLLRPSGVRLQSGTLSLRVYRGEDLPQMDPGYFEGVKSLLGMTAQKELVDPYCTVSFAGHKGRTEVIWNEQDPEWNHQINLPIRFPSMCERIRFQMKDKDKLGADDYIGTTFLNLSEVSAPGENGFLPTFGPCFLNVYGSPREFTDMPDKFDHLNKGLIEGVAYRGRVMVEVSMELGKLPTDKHETIKIVEQKKIPQFLRRHKYKLYAAMFSGTLVEPVDSAVEFEISIGNYGNKLEKNVAPQASTTQPTNPVYDGNSYYFLPWMDTKPCVVVDSQWEDCSYRIQALNLIIFLADQLNEGLEVAKKRVSIENCDLDEVRMDLGECLDTFIDNLVSAIKWLDPETGTAMPKTCTRLDVLTRDRRLEELKYLLGEAGHLRSSEEVRQCIDEIDDYVGRLRTLTSEPQNCIPDVIIWMLSGNKRVASTRIPSHKLMYSPTAKTKGSLCGKITTIFLTPPAVEKEEELEDQEGGAQLRLLLWLGLEEHQSLWAQEVSGGTVAVYAETYENEGCVFGHWSSTAATRPNWSDSKGKIKQPKDAFVSPEGWRWDGDWFISPELSIAFEPDEGLNEWHEEIYENQMRMPFSSWATDSESSYWSDIRGDKIVEYEGKNEKALSRDDIKCPEAWKWESEWEVDKNRACDDDGWEYCVESGMAAWVPYERNMHMCRRRRWVRMRVRITDPKIIEKQMAKRKKAIEEGWEYARLANLTYHLTERTMDFARRRRWHRKLVAVDPGKPAIFCFDSKKKKKKDKDDDDDDAKQQVPRMYLTFKDCHTYQLRAYLYQAREMHSADKSGLSDPYAIMSFGRYSTTSRVIKESVCPTWDQTMVIDQIRLFGEPGSVKSSPPRVMVEFYDKDTVGEDEFIGKVVCVPKVRFDLEEDSAPRLDWYDITRYNKPAGEMLAAFELFLDEGGDLPFAPPTAQAPAKHFIVPSGIRPVLQKTRIEILCWGVRDMKRFQLLPVESPLVEVECGGTVVRSKHIDDASKNPNFPEPVMTVDVLLPKEELYAPPLNIRILDKRTFGRTPMVGTHIIKSLKDFMVEPVPSEAQAAAIQATAVVALPAKPSAAPEEDLAIIMEETAALDSDPDQKKASDFDWWSKYYYSIGDEKRTQKEYVDQGYDKLAVYSTELEEQFNNFTDLATTFCLFRGKGSRDPDDSEGQGVGLFKGAVKAYHLPDDGSPMPQRIMSNIPSTAPTECVVRVYIIKGLDLQPQDPGGRSDPYIKVKIGKQEINDKDNYIPNQLNPLFGRMFEIPATFPVDHTLSITVMDYDRLSADDLIGATSIDLENRFLSQHRALCGLPETFSKRGPAKWRDRELPKTILQEYCSLKHLPDPQWLSKTQVVFNGNTYTLEQFEQGKEVNSDWGVEDERLALHVLHQQNLVPEHVENRTLYNPMQPNIPQGTLHMWVDIFPKGEGKGNVPPPIDIASRKPEKHLLRIVVWNTKDVILDEVSIATGEAMSDIYVKGWLRGQDESQKTDTHYRSMDGEGNFNWRLVYPFDYLPSEQIMVIKKKQHFYSLDKTEVHLPPILTVQVWDNDLFNPDDFIGTLDFNLVAMPEPARNASGCSLTQLPEDGKKQPPLMNLFKKKRAKGWWPVFTEETGVRELAGKLELELEIVSEEEEQLRPAGKARDEPNLNPTLEPPNRPATSFLWFTSPFKTFKHIIWKFYKWHIICGIVAVIFVLLIVIFVYTAPSSFMNLMMDRILPG